MCSRTIALFVFPPTLALCGESVRSEANSKIGLPAFQHLNEERPPACASFRSFDAVQTAGVCGVGIFTIKDFSFEGEGLKPAAVSIFAASTGNRVRFDHSTSPAEWSATGANFTIRYTVDPPPEILDGFEASLETNSLLGARMFFRAQQAPRGVRVDFQICPGASVAHCPPSQVRRFTLDSVTPSAAVRFPHPTAIVGVEQHVRAEPGAGCTGVSSRVTVGTSQSGGAAIFFVGALTLFGAIWARKTRDRGVPAGR
jgi:hypothetical protein